MVRTLAAFAVSLLLSVAVLPAQAAAVDAAPTVRPHVSLMLGIARIGDRLVVVGERGLVSRWVMPFSRQIRSNITSAGRGRPNRPVNCLPLSVRTSPGIPYSVIAVVNARQTARAVARMTTVAMTQNREWTR